MTFNKIEWYDICRKLRLGAPSHGSGTYGRVRKSAVRAGFALTKFFAKRFVAVWRRSTLDGYLYSDLRGSGDSRSIASSSACAFSMCTAGGALAIVVRSSFAGLGTSAEFVTALSSPARLGSCCCGAG